MIITEVTYMSLLYALLDPLKTTEHGYIHSIPIIITIHSKLYTSRELTIHIANLHSCNLNHKHGCTKYMTRVVTPKPYPINVHLLQVKQYYYNTL